MSDSVRPHRRQPTRFPHPWDSPGKNTGVGCHFLLQHMKMKSESEIAQSCPTLSNLVDCSLPASSVHGIFQARVLEWSAIAFSDILSYLLSKRMGCLSGCLVFSDSVQKLLCGSCSAFKWSFDEFVGEKVVSPSYSSAILGLPPLFFFSMWKFNFFPPSSHICLNLILVFPLCSVYLFCLSMLWFYIV